MDVAHPQQGGGDPVGGKISDLLAASRGRLAHPIGVIRHYRMHIGTGMSKGSPRIRHALKTLGWHVSRRRVTRLVRRAGLRAKAVQGYRAKAKIHRFYARHANRLWQATLTGPNQGLGWPHHLLQGGERLALSRDRDGSAHVAHSGVESHAPTHGLGDECCPGRRNQAASRTWGDRSQ